MPSSLDVLLFGAGAAVIAWSLVWAMRFTPKLKAAGLDRRWRWLLGLMACFVLGYLGALALSLAEKLELLAGLTSVVFFLGALYVAFTVLLARSMTRRLLGISQGLERRIKERTRELEDSNRRLREAKSEAEAVNRAKSHFLANMSHEIRTPLTAILGYTDLMLRGTPAENERVKNLRVVRRNGQHLLELINDVLDISKIEAGEMTVEILDCSPWQLVREVRSLLRHQAQAKNLDFKIDTDGPIPEYVKSDPVRLRQILLNLIGNAIKFTESGTVKVVVSMAEPSPQGRDRIRFDVIDTGIGMNALQQKHVFQPFRQASISTSRVFGGTGLGLTISRRLARMLGGDVTVVSTLEVGSTFTLTIDAGTVKTDDLIEGPLRMETLETVTAPAGAQWTRKLGGRILLAEDGVDNRRFISAILQQVGAEVTLVENGQQAFDHAMAARDKDRPFDAVLMDMQMPVLDGYAAAQKLREAGYEGWIVALTAYAMSGDREKCLAAGCDDFVTKPIDVEQFLASLARHVANPRTGPVVAKQTCTSAPDPSTVDAEGIIVSTLAGHPTLGGLVEGFVERLPKRLEELSSAFDSSDLGTLENLAHGLRGAGGTYGFKLLTEAAEKLEECIKQGGAHSEIAAAMDRLTRVCQRVSA